MYLYLKIACGGVVLKKLKILAVLIVIAIGISVYNNRPVKFIDTFTHGRVNQDYRALAREIFDESGRAVSGVIVAEASKSRNCIRWVFISEARLTTQQERQILDRIMAVMREQALGFPLVWEVFFTSEEMVNSAYVSRFGEDSMVTWLFHLDPEGEELLPGDGYYFRRWESVPYATATLPYDVLTTRMIRQNINVPMYEINSSPIRRLTPNVPS